MIIQENVAPRFPLSATDFYQVLDMSDVNSGMVNIVTGDRDHLTKTLVQHERCGLGLVLRLGGRQLLSGVRVRRQHEADVGRLRPAARLDGSRAGRRSRVFARVYSGEEYLGADGGIRPSPSPMLCILERMPTGANSCCNVIT